MRFYDLCLKKQDNFVRIEKKILKYKIKEQIKWQVK